MATIVFEGSDQVGKSTQSQLLMDDMKKMGFSVVRVEPRKDSKFFKRVTDAMLVSGSAKRYPTVFQLLNFANKFVFQTFDLPRLNKKYDYIIIDRWKMTFQTYGYMTKVPKDIIDTLSDFLFEPHINIVLLGDPHVRGPGDSYENDETLQLLVRVKYRELSKMNSWNTEVIDVERDDTIEQIRCRILNVLHEIDIY